jgi:phage terminase large subunit-like protein
VGGRGAGKTWVGAYDELMRASLTPGLYACYAPTFDMVEQLSMRTLLDTGRKLGIVTNVAKLIVTLTNGSEILCRSLDDPEHARGGNFSGCWMDEASLVPREAFDIVIASLRQEGRQGWLSATFTPKGRGHWTYEVFGLGGPGTLLVRATTHDNPFLPPTFYDMVAGQYAGPLRQQELEGEFIDIEGGLAKREWFQIVDAAPAQARRVRFWDMAATEKSAKSSDPDWTVGSKWAEANGIYYIEHVIRERIEAAFVMTVIGRTAQADGAAVTVNWERKAARPARS